MKIKQLSSERRDMLVNSTFLGNSDENEFGQDTNEIALKSVPHHTSAHTTFRSVTFFSGSFMS
jgi:hypothetical protein